VKVNFRVAATESGNIRLEACLIEPSEHHIKLSTQDEPYEGQRKFLKSHRLAQDAAENLRSFEIRQLASGDLQFFPGEFRWALERQGYKGSDVIRGNRLVRLIPANGVC